MGNSRRSTILELYESVSGPVAKVNMKRYAESTQTLYKDNVFVADEINETKVKDVFVDTETYKKIVRNEKPYLVLKKDNFRLSEDIRLIEISPERRTVYKTIVNIETSSDEPGLKEEYMILTLQ